MLWRVLSFDLTNLIFAACFTLRGHDTRVDFSVGFVSGGQDWPSDPKLTLFVEAK